MAGLSFFGNLQQVESGVIVCDGAGRANADASAMKKATRKSLLIEIAHPAAQGLSSAPRC
jgi:hypothetical protein